MSGGAYGTPPVQAELRARGRVLEVNRVARRMRGGGRGREPAPEGRDDEAGRSV